jgi:hypothetical protein
MSFNVLMSIMMEDVEEVLMRHLLYFVDWIIQMPSMKKGESIITKQTPMVMLLQRSRQTDQSLYGGGNGMDDLELQLTVDIQI